MRPQQNRRMRGRGNNNRKGPNPLTRSYESNGPDVKIRGSAQQIAEKYTTLARDAQTSGDRVMAENYLQHAEHDNRVIMAAQSQMGSRKKLPPMPHRGVRAARGARAPRATRRRTKARPTRRRSPKPRSRLDPFQTG